MSEAWEVDTGVVPPENELCACGHTKAEHGASRHLDIEEDRVVGSSGHGACRVPGCRCWMFTWVGWHGITQEEVFRRGRGAS